MKTSQAKHFKIPAGPLLKGLALGLICCAFIAARGNVEALFVAFSRAITGSARSIDDVEVELAKGKSAREIIAQLSDPAVCVILGLTLSACLAFGFSEGRRLVRTRELERALRAKSARILQANRRLKELSVTDPLTGLANRRLFFKRLEDEQIRAQRYSSPLSCMMIDIDYFKNVNDTFGHQFGDFVLEEIGRVLAAECRQVDTVGRYGGEEFAVVMPNTTVQDAETLAERIRAALASHRFEHGGLSTSITVTVGIAACLPEDGRDAARLLSRADAALYEGKKSGRNAVVAWSDALRAREESDGSAGKYMDEGRLQDLRERMVELSSDLQSTYFAALHSLLSAVKMRDEYALKHSDDVACYARAIARQMGLEEAEVESVANAASLHDIGKLGIDEKILAKAAELSDGEYAAIKSHPMMAAQILGPLKFLSREIPMIVHHHERYGGGGYPHGLAGEEIPLGARIIALADAFSAMTNERPYKKSVPALRALKELAGEAGKQFDPAVVRAFMEAIHADKIALPPAKTGDASMRNAG